MLRLIYLSAAIALVTSAGSCNKCYECDFNGDKREICAKDLPDGMSGLKLTIDGYESRGYVCTAK